MHGMAWRSGAERGGMKKSKERRGRGSCMICTIRKRGGRVERGGIVGRRGMVGWEG